MRTCKWFWYIRGTKKIEEKKKIEDLYPLFAPNYEIDERCPEVNSRERVVTHACMRVSREHASRVLRPGALKEHCRLFEMVSDDVAFGRVALEERQHESTMHPRIPLSRCGGGGGRRPASQPGPAAHTQLSNIRGGLRWPPRSYKACLASVGPSCLTLY